MSWKMCEQTLWGEILCEAVLYGRIDVKNILLRKQKQCQKASVDQGEQSLDNRVMK